MKQYLLTLLLLFSFHVVWADNETKKELEENKESIDRANVDQLSTTVLQQQIEQLKKEKEREDADWRDDDKSLAKKQVCIY